ncbi:MAG: sodium/proline symporter [Planctomycetes bacterium]|nr:sodium/proline symporter [Planctomycetota bacterium]
MERRVVCVARGVIDPGFGAGWRRGAVERIFLLMDKATAILITLVIYKVTLIAIGLYAERKTKDGTDFFLGGRRLGPLVAAISASASSSSAWTLLGVSGLAYAKGLSALWLFPGCVGGFCINWFLLAPRLHRISREENALTLTDVLAGEQRTEERRPVRWLAGTIVLACLAFYVAAQFQGSGKAFAEFFELDTSTAILIGSGIVVFYTLIGGFWAVSLTDTLQGLLMAITSVVLPVAAFVVVEQRVGFATGLARVTTPGYLNLFGDAGWISGAGFAFGLLGIGIGYPGQPHVVNRFMALRSGENEVRNARRIAIAWAVCVYAGMLLLGLCGRILLSDLADRETVFLAMADEIFPPVLAGIMLAAVLSAIMSTADSQLLVAASAATHDLELTGRGDTTFLSRSRLVILVLSAGAVLLALFGSQRIFDPVLFAWSAMGAAFGPLVLVRAFRGPVRPRPTMFAMGLGFLLSVIAYTLPETKSTWIERWVPFAVAYAVAWWGSRE